MSNLNKYPKDKNGKPHGEWITYWDRGILFDRENYVHGIPHGLWERYFFDGRLYYRGYFNMGSMSEFWLFNKEKRYHLCLI